MPPTKKADRRQGFSLVEILIAMTLSVIIAGIAAWFIGEGMRFSLRTAASADNDFTQWSVSSRLQLDTKLANGASIYANLATADLKSSLRRLGGQRGNLLILSSSERITGSSKSRYTHITGYLYDSAESRLSKFEHDVSSAQRASFADLETILISNLGGYTFTTVANGVESLDSTGPFVSRDVGNINAATATFKLEQGSEFNHTGDTSVVEVSFLIR